jgi:hypothetical protein
MNKIKKDHERYDSVFTYSSIIGHLSIIYSALYKMLLHVFNEKKCVMLF